MVQPNPKTVRTATAAAGDREPVATSKTARMQAIETRFETVVSAIL